MTDLDRIRTALDKLPPLTKRAFVLVRYDGLSVTEAAARLNIRKRRAQRLITRAFEACQGAIHEPT